MKYHYKLSSKPIEQGCFVIFTKGSLRNEIHLVVATHKGKLWKSSQTYGNGLSTVWVHPTVDSLNRPLRIQVTPYVQARFSRSNRLDVPLHLQDV